MEEKVCEESSMYAAGGTHVGLVRSQNQDNYFLCPTQIGPLPNLFIVADGMGGHKAGDIASKVAVDTFVEGVRNYNSDVLIGSDFYSDLMVSELHVAGKKILEMSESNEDFDGMGTTFSACVVTEDKIYMAHIGDSRIYAISSDYQIKQLTKDHTLVNELLQEGKITAEEAKIHPRRNILTKVIGTTLPLGADCGNVMRLGVDSLLLCSDGLSNMVDEETLVNIVNGRGHVDHRIDYLIKKALERGGLDNITAVLVELTPRSS
jgi:protein phosphatase